MNEGGSPSSDAAIDTASCQQLRLHDSSRLDICLKITAGAILEGCNSIVFYQPEAPGHQDTATIDDNDTGAAAKSEPRFLLSVHDFDWLRRSIPSPNYQVLPSSSFPTLQLELHDPMPSQGPSKSTAPGTAKATEGNSIPITDTERLHDDESEDEL